MIGKPLWFDKSTRLDQRLGYPRVCMEMGIDSEFQDFLHLVPDRRPAYNVHIELCNKPAICAKCCKFGHNCEEIQDEKHDTGSVVEVVQELLQVESEGI
ncbi:unnamed protein product [Linum trigynum]|uniref:Uncharacterized protein n=1 Tax=Linum trigynum TaxID=586398 RepID=A0AAV2FBG7_9ROSI